MSGHSETVTELSELSRAGLVGVGGRFPGDLSFWVLGEGDLVCGIAGRGFDTFLLNSSIESGV